MKYVVDKIKKEMDLDIDYDDANLIINLKKYFNNDMVKTFTYILENDICEVNIKIIEKIKKGIKNEN